MKFSYFRRPLVLALASYALLIVVLESRGLLGVPSEEDPSRFAPLESASLEGAVDGLPVPWRGGERFVLRLESVEGKPCRGRCWAVSRRVAGLRPGDRVRVRGGLSLSPRHREPGQMDFAGYLSHQGIHSLCAVGEVLEVRPSSSRMVRAASALRRRAQDAFSSSLKPLQASILSGIVLGAKSELTQETRSAFSDAGAMHLLVASGSNVAFVLGMVYLAARLLKLPRRWSVWPALVAAGLYTQVAGAEPPLVRAYVMAAFALVGYLLGRDSGAFQGLVVSGLGILLFDPLQLFQASFQLSYAATLGIVVAVPRWAAATPGPRGVRILANLFWTSLAAQLAIYPLLAGTFHRVSVTALLSNLILVPLSGVLMVAGFVMTAACYLPWEAPLAWTAWAAGHLLDGFWEVVRFFSGFSWSAVPVAGLSGPGTALYYAAFLGLAALPDRALALRILGLDLAGWAGLALASVAYPPPPRILFLGSARGEAPAHLICQSGSSGVLVNAGLKPHRLRAALLDAGVSSLDGLVLLSGSPRSWTALEGLSTLTRISTVYLPEEVSEDPALGPALGRLRAAGVRMRTFPSGRGVQVGGFFFVKPPDGRGGWVVRCRGHEVSLEAESSGSLVAIEEPAATGRRPFQARLSLRSGAWAARFLPGGVKLERFR